MRLKYLKAWGKSPQGLQTLACRHHTLLWISMLVYAACLFSSAKKQDGAAKNKMALLCSDAVQVALLRLCFYLLFYLLLLSIFTHITSALITYDKGTLYPRILYPRIHPGHSRFFGTRRGTMATGDGTRNTMEKALEFATDWGKGLKVLHYRAFCSLMSNPWRIRWTILQPG